MTYMSGYSTHNMDRATWLAAGRALDGHIIRPSTNPRDERNRNVTFGSDYWLLSRAEMLQPWYPGEAGAILRTDARSFVRELLPVDLAEELAYEVTA